MAAAPPSAWRRRKKSPQSESRRAPWSGAWPSRALVAGAAAVALIAAGCGGSGEHASPQIKPRRVYTYTSTAGPQDQDGTCRSVGGARSDSAAELTAAKPGFSASVRARIGVPQLGGDVTAVGTGRFDPHSQSGTLNLAVTLPGLFGLAGPLPTQVVLAGHEAYVQVPAESGGRTADVGILARGEHLRSGPR